VRHKQEQSRRLYLRALRSQNPGILENEAPIKGRSFEGVGTGSFKKSFRESLQRLRRSADSGSEPSLQRLFPREETAAIGNRLLGGVR